MKDNFSTQANQYANFRPHYPAALFNFIFENVNHFDTALDVATGNGQAASVLAEQFKKVYATDISQKQLEHAIQKENIVYSVEPAEQFSFPDQYFDLITVAQAIHWFDFDKFFTEVNRTLKADGLFAMIGYGLLRVDEKINPILDHFYTTVIGPYWDKERKHIDEQYINIPFPFIEMASPKLFMEYEWTLDHFVNYMGTWSAVQHFIKQHSSNPIDCEMLQSLQLHWDAAEKKKVRFPLFIKAGRKKS